MIFNMLYSVYTKFFHIHTCPHPSADKVYSFVPERRNSIGGEEILLVRHFFSVSLYRNDTLPVQVTTHDSADSADANISSADKCR